jgi:hypothetical protein
VVSHSSDALTSSILAVLLPNHLADSETWEMGKREKKWEMSLAKMNFDQRGIYFYLSLKFSNLLKVLSDSKIVNILTFW